jgi:thiol:disulfide interchange protein DsbC
MEEEMRSAKWLAPVALITSSGATAQSTPQDRSPDLNAAAADAQRQLRQTFTNLEFEDFGPAPLKGPLYQASAGGRILYYAPESEHIIFGAVYDSTGVNITALSQDQSARKRLNSLDKESALAIGPAGARQVVEFTDPDCPYCRALDRFWNSRAAAGKMVRRLIYFVTGIHPGAAAKAEHILCSKDPETAFRAIYSGQQPDQLLTCPDGAARLARHGVAVKSVGLSGTPTLIIGEKIISGFAQGEIETQLGAMSRKTQALGPPGP